MPISFVLTGIMFFLFAFDFLVVDNVNLKKIILTCLILFMCGFFIGDVVLDGFKFNILQLVVVCVFLLYGFIVFRLKVVDFCYVFLFFFGYCFVLNNDLNFLISYNDFYFLFMLTISAFLYFGNIKKGVLFLVLASVLVFVYSGYIESCNFGFSTINFSVLGELVVVYVLLSQMLNFVVNHMCRRRYVKKVSTIYDVNNFNIFSFTR